MSKTPSVNFGAWLRAQMRARGSYGADFAARVGVRPSTVYGWTSGQHVPLDPQVARIAAALALDPAAVWAVLARDGVTPMGPPERPRPIPPAAESPPAERRFARWLRSALAARRVTPAQLARALGVDHNTVLRWTGGLQAPASVHGAGLAAALGVDIATIRDALNRADSAESAGR